jgi:YihY family inner membrane protein
MNAIDSFKHKFDAFQQKHDVLAYPAAVIKRYQEDEAGKLAALITYYGFLALFPLLLIFITVASLASNGDPQLQASISRQVFQFFPALGSELQENVHEIHTGGIALVLELLVLFYGIRGLSSILQQAFNHVWHIDKHHRAGFLGEILRGFAMMMAVGVGIVIGTIFSYVIGRMLDIGLYGSILLTLTNVVIICSLFLVVFRLGTTDRVRLHWLIPGAVIAGLGVMLVQHFGVYIMGHQLPKLRGTYGSFALALGMLFWIYLQAQIIMYALEITAVRTQKDWPKKLFDEENPT